MFCTYCGKENPNEADYCLQCGRHLQHAAAAAKSDRLGSGVVWLSLLVPTIGFVLAAVYWDEQPKVAKKCLRMAVLNTIVCGVGTALITKFSSIFAKEFADELFREVKGFANELFQEVVNEF